MALGIHRDEALQLQQARIDHTPGTRVGEADALDRGLFQLAHGDAAAEIGDFGGGGIRVDRPADQRQAAGLGVGVFLGEIGGGGQRQRHRLANRDDMDVGAKMAHEIDEVEGVILDVELALGHRNIAGVVPVRHIDVAVGQQADDRRAQQGGVVTRHRRDQQHLALHGRAATHEKVDQVAERAFDHGFHVDQVVLTIGAGDRADAPARLGNHATEGALCHLAPGRCHLDHRVHRKREGRV